MLDTMSYTCSPDCPFTEDRTREHLLHHILNGIPTGIPFSDINLLPDRKHFLNQRQRELWKGQVSTKKPLLFMPNATFERTEYVDRQAVYRLYIAGILPCGSKTLVRLDDIPIFVDIRVPEGTSDREYGNWLRGIMMERNIKFKKVDTVKLFPMDEFSIEKLPYRRVWFNNLKDRKQLIDYIHKQNVDLKAREKPLIETSSDDCGFADYYFAKLAREQRFSTADWNRMETYEVLHSPMQHGNFQFILNTQVDYVIAVSVENFRPLDAERRKKLDKPGGALEDVLERDSTIVSQWDIETFRTIENGMVPTPEDQDFTIFMMCSAHFFQYTATPFWTMCCVDQYTPPSRKVPFVIQCGTEQNVLRAYMIAMGRISPDILAAFNGSNFDWPLYWEMCRRNGLMVDLSRQFSAISSNRDTEESITKWGSKSERVKINAEANHDCKKVVTFSGMIDTDVMPVFLKLYPKNEVKKAFSLNFFLQKNGIDGKADMPYKKMFRIYARSREFNNVTQCHCHEFKKAVEHLWSAEANSSLDASNKSTDASNKSTDDIGDTSPDDISDKSSLDIGDTSTDISDKSSNVPEHTHAQWRELITQCAKFSKEHRNCPCKIVPEVDCDPDPDPEAEDQYLRRLIKELRDSPRCCLCSKKDKNLEGMTDIAYYCIIDCIRPQQLYVKRVIVSDKRELSNLSMVSVYDSFYRADGMKVRNLCGSEAWKRETAFSNARSLKTQSEKQHYPGALVIIPTTGLNQEDPLCGVDYSSLYPSLMRAFNLSKEKIVKTFEKAKRLQELGYTLHRIEPFEYEIGEKKGVAGNEVRTASGWTVRHNGVHDPEMENVVSHYEKHYKYEFALEHFAAFWEEVSALNDVASTAKAVGANVTAKANVEDTNTSVEEKYRLKKTSKSFSIQILSTQPLPAALQGVKSKKKVVRHPVPGRKKLIGEEMGIFPYLLDNLFNMRVPIKAEFVRLCKLLEELELKDLKEIEDNGKLLSINELEFQIAKTDSKQRAVKILSNTFYGESGNFRSGIYELLVAAGVTCAGQDNLRAVADFVTELGFKPQYGDTDSVYITSPAEIYQREQAVFDEEMALVEKKYAGVERKALPETELEIAYKNERVEVRKKLWREKVANTMKRMNILTEEISDFLIGRNGTPFLNMAYEEIGFPYVLCGKKKYFFTAHIETINFYPKSYFMRGIEIVKQGQADISKELGNEFIAEVLSPENERTLLEIAEDKIRKVAGMTIPIEKFALKAKYKPLKKNVPVLRFVERMREKQELYKDDPQLFALYEPPEPGDKFTYVVVLRDDEYSVRGKRIDLKKGDRMEFMRVYLDSQKGSNPLVIDRDYYIKNAVLGIFARFITAEKTFHPPAGKYNLEDKEEYKLFDKEVVANASKFLEQLWDKLTGHDPNARRQLGAQYRQTFRNVTKRVQSDLFAKMGGNSICTELIDLSVRDTREDLRSRQKRIVDQLLESLEYKDVANAPTTTVSTNASTDASTNTTVGTDTSTDKATSGVVKEVDLKYIKRYIRDCGSRGISAYKLYRLYAPINKRGLLHMQGSQLASRKNKLIKELYRALGPTSKIIYDYEKRFIALVNEARDSDLSDEDIERINNFDSESKANLKEVSRIILYLKAIELQKKRLALLIKELKSLIDLNDRPIVDIKELSAKESKEALVLEEFEWK